jgi:hypothetical protein
MLQKSATFDSRKCTIPRQRRTFVLPKSSTFDFCAQGVAKVGCKRELRQSSAANFCLSTATPVLPTPASHFIPCAHLRTAGPPQHRSSHQLEKEPARNAGPEDTILLFTFCQKPAAPKVGKGENRWLASSGRNLLWRGFSAVGMIPPRLYFFCPKFSISDNAPHSTCACTVCWTASTLAARYEEFFSSP